MAQDILIDDTGDLVITNGDFKIGTSDEQHVVLLVNTSMGAWKQFPLVGVGIIQYSASSGETATLKRNISEQMQRDGFYNVEVSLEAIGDSFNYYVSANRLD